MNDILHLPPDHHLDDAIIRGGMDLLVFAHKSHLQRADDELEALGLGRADHRVLYFVARRPWMTIGELLDILQITKQSAARVLNNLIAKGYLHQEVCPRDRRRRLLQLTQEGAALEQRIAADLHANMKRAYLDAGEQAVRGYWLMMQHLMTPEVRQHFRSFREASFLPSERQEPNAARSNG